jgi:hypothetical protein
MPAFSMKYRILTNGKFYKVQRKWQLFPLWLTFHKDESGPTIHHAVRMPRYFDSLPAAEEWLMEYIKPKPSFDNWRICKSLDMNNMKNDKTVSNQQ